MVQQTHAWDPSQGQAFQGDLMLMQVPERLLMLAPPEHGGGGMLDIVVDLVDTVVGWPSEAVVPRNDNLVVCYGYPSAGLHLVPLDGAATPQTRSFRSWDRKSSVQLTSYRARLPVGVAEPAGMVSLHSSFRVVRSAMATDARLCSHLSVAFLFVEDGVAAISQRGRATIIIPPGRYHLGRRWRTQDLLHWRVPSLEPIGVWSPTSQHLPFEYKSVLSMARLGLLKERDKWPPEFVQAMTGPVTSETVRLFENQPPYDDLLIERFGLDRFVREVDLELQSEDASLGRRRRLYKHKHRRLLETKTSEERSEWFLVNWPGMSWPTWQTPTGGGQWYKWFVPWPDLPDGMEYVPRPPGSGRADNWFSMHSNPHEAVASSYACSPQTFREAFRT